MGDCPLGCVVFPSTASFREDLTDTTPLVSSHLAGFTTQANEFSLHMVRSPPFHLFLPPLTLPSSTPSKQLIASSFLLNTPVEPNSLPLHPYLHSFSNTRNEEELLRASWVPDVRTEEISEGEADFSVRLPPCFLLAALLTFFASLPRSPSPCRSLFPVDFHTYLFRTFLRPLLPSTTASVRCRRLPRPIQVSGGRMGRLRDVFLPRHCAKHRRLSHGPFHASISCLPSWRIGAKMNR
jgi:hypothetical protein